MKALLQRRNFLFGAILLLIVVGAALGADWLAPFDPVKNNYRNRLGAPDDVFLLGTDRFGRDVLSRILFGAQVSLRIALIVAGSVSVTGAVELLASRKLGIGASAACASRRWRRRRGGLTPASTPGPPRAHAQSRQD